MLSINTGFDIRVEMQRRTCHARDSGKVLTCSNLLLVIYDVLCITISLLTSFPFVDSLLGKLFTAPTSNIIRYRC